MRGTEEEKQRGKGVCTPCRAADGCRAPRVKGRASRPLSGCIVAATCLVTHTHTHRAGDDNGREGRKQKNKPSDNMKPVSRADNR